MLLTSRSRQVTTLMRERDKIIAENKERTKRQQHPHNPLSAALQDGAWQGEPCFIIGGGPSLRGFDFERLRGKGRIIAINKAIEFVPFADLLFFMDWKFYKLYHEPSNIDKWTAFEGKKAFLNLMGRKIDDVYSIRSLGRTGCSRSVARGLYHGNNSGVGALQLALAMRAKPIYLLGYDMRHMGGHSHFHGGYRHRQSDNVARSFLRDFVAMKKHMKGDERIINLSPESALRIFPFGNIDEVLNGYHRKGLGDDALPVPESVVLSPSPAG